MACHGFKSHLSSSEKKAGQISCIVLPDEVYIKLHAPNRRLCVVCLCVCVCVCVCARACMRACVYFYLVALHN